MGRIRESLVKPVGTHSTASLVNSLDDRTGTQWNASLPTTRECARRDSSPPGKGSGAAGKGGVKSGVFTRDIPCAAGSNGRMTSELQPAIRVVMMPRDTNPMGTIFGGLILSYIDQAGAVEAHKHSEKNLVTVAMHEVKFIAPVFVGDLVSFYAETVRIGRTSITVRITVEARRGHPPHDVVRVTQAEVVYVAVDEPGKAVPVRD